MKRKFNRSKRAKIGSHGFKVYKNTYVYIAKARQDARMEAYVNLVERLI